MKIINNTFLSRAFVEGYLEDLRNRNKKAYDEKEYSEKISINNKEYYIDISKSNTGYVEIDLEEIK